jgi:RNA polymerase sigma factor (sigma-70 family)
MSQASAFNPNLRRDLIAMVRKRVPDSEVEDIVQSTLAEAIESPHAPQDSESLRRWIFGVAKNKVVDYHRRAGRESFDLPEVAGSPAPHDEADMLRWAEKHLPEGDDAKRTLGWMLREGEGEKLESIAQSEHVPAPRVRQRVSRLRRHFKDNWQRELALLAAVGVVITILVVWLKKKEGPEPIAHDPNNVPIDPRAEPMRQQALERCAASDWAKCLDGLDQAKRMDPAGDARPEVQRARQDAEKALTPPAPTSATPITPPPTPTSSATPPSPKTSSTFSSDLPSDFPSDSLSFGPKGKTATPVSSGSPVIAKPQPKAGPSKVEGKKGYSGKPASTEITPVAPPPTSTLSPSKGDSK